MPLPHISNIADNVQFFNTKVLGELVSLRMGFLLGIRGKTTLQPGTLIDRYGPPSGKFVSPEGTPFPQRALPWNSQYDRYTRYQVIKPIEVEEGLVAPWFDQPGLGKQYKFNMTIEQLLKDKYIIELY